MPKAKSAPTQKTALLSVSDKTGIVEFARGLTRLGYRLLSTGGTAALLRANKLAVIEVADVTGFPEILGGRVKTLHPAVFGGILSDGSRAHAAELQKHGITSIEVICVNLYPFAEAVADPKTTLAEAVEEIDIGGVSLLRAAAKNFARVAVVSKPSQYATVLAQLKKGQTAEERRQLAAAAFAQTAKYDGLITGYLGGEQYFTPIFEGAQRLRYGENPHQAAVLYREPDARPGVANAAVLQGKPLSFNNLVDADVALKLVADFTTPTAAVIKHANPCGVATKKTIAEALTAALDADKKSPFGGIIALNRPVDAATAKIIAPFFMELVIAPSFDAAARRILAKKVNLRLLAVGAIHADPAETEVKKVSGGLLVQTVDFAVPSKKDLKLVTQKPANARDTADLLFAMTVVKHVKSNAIVLARDGVTVGICGGQTSRVDAAAIAAARAGSRASGAVAASDAFFPFSDTVDVLARAGVAAIIQPGGSLRDDESIAAADRANVAMVFTGVRSFRH